MRILLVLMLILTVSAPLYAAAPKDLVKAELLADVASVQPGQPFTAGIRLTMKPHWHVYWKNPGDAGQATSVEWKLPQGFTAGELKFPIPVTFEQPGPVIGYGYENEVLLTATITPPADLVAGKTIDLEAAVTWLVCDPMTCIPGNASLKLQLPTGPETKPANAELFAKGRQQFPVPLDASPVNQTGPIKQTGIEGTAGGATAFVKWAKMPADVQWFPLPPQKSGVENLQTRSEGDVSRMTFSLSPAPKGPAQMQFLVAFTDENGKRQGVEFGVKLPPAAK